MKSRGAQEVARWEESVNLSFHRLVLLFRDRDEEESRDKTCSWIWLWGEVSSPEEGCSGRIR